MDKLIKCVLPVSPRLSPYNGSGGVVDMRTTTCDILSIGFHVTLIKKKSQWMPVYFRMFGKKPAQKKKAWVIFFPKYP